MKYSIDEKKQLLSNLIVEEIEKRRQSDRRYSDASLAREMGITTSGLSRYINKDVLPDWRNGYRIGRVLPKALEILELKEFIPSDPVLAFIITNYHDNTIFTAEDKNQIFELVQRLQQKKSKRKTGQIK